jgi:hypothetical protein
VKPLLQVAVQTRPTAEEAPQLKTPLAGLAGLFLQVTGDCWQLPVVAVHAPLDWHVAEGAPAKPLLQVAVQTRPAEEDIPQL